MTLPPPKKMVYDFTYNCEKVAVFLYSTTKLEIGQPPSDQASKLRTIEVELAVISSPLLSISDPDFDEGFGGLGEVPRVLADTVSVRSPTPKSFTA